MPVQTSFGSDRTARSAFNWPMIAFKTAMVPRCHQIEHALPELFGDRYILEKACQQVRDFLFIPEHHPRWREPTLRRSNRASPRLHNGYGGYLLARL